MKIIALYGGRNSKKELLAMKLANNPNIVYVRPYTDREVPVNQEDWEQDGYTHLNEKQLSHKMEREVPLATIQVDGDRYVFFENQLRADYCVLILDDAGLYNLGKIWSGELLTIRVHSDGEMHSDRCLMSDEEFDIVFDYDNDDIELILGEL